MNEIPHTGGATPCANCGTLGAGRYCSACGQRRDIHLHSLGHFLGEATEVITHADSTLWRTLLPLVTRPGFLVREFIAGRRARTLQPFRLYLIASLAFFLVGSWTGEEPALLATQPAPAQAPGAQQYTGKAACEHNGLEGTALARFAPRMRAACESVTADGGRAFGRSIYHNLGRAMFVFVPLLAAFMKLLYWRPKRFYLEHLLLLLYNHAAVFIAGAVYDLLTLVVRSPGAQGFMRFALLLYLAWYLFRSMRVNYGQGRALTALKFVALAGAYGVAATLMLGLTAVYSALTL
jgi:hypothetical protein